MPRLPSVVLLLAVLATACPQRSDDGGGDGGLPAPACAEGLRERAEGPGCEAILPEVACPAGHAAFLGESACTKVGWSACPPGFAPAGDGWGCQAILPAAPCSGASMSVLGSPACEPVGDCAAPFPPAGATHFVDPAAPAGDPIRFRTIGAALAAAPAGAVIAIEAGTYPEALAPSRAVTLVGRCAEQVQVGRPLLLARSRPGLAVDGPFAVEARGLRFLGHRIGISAARGAQVTLREVIVEEASGLGLAAGDPGSVIQGSRILVRQVLPEDGGLGLGLAAIEGGRLALETVEVDSARLEGAYVEGGEAELRGLVIRGLQVPEAAILVIGGRLDARGVALVDVSGRGVAVFEGSTAEVSEADLTLSRAAATGWGVSVEGGASLRLEQARVAGATEFGVGLLDPGTALEVASVTVLDVAEGPESGVGAGLVVSEGAATVRSAALARLRGFGLVAELGARVEVEGLHVRSAQAVGSEYFVGGGIMVQFASVVEGGRIDLASCEPLGLLVSEEGRATLEGVVVRQVRPAGGYFGGGGFAQRGGHLQISRCAIHDVEGSGLAAKWARSSGEAPGRVEARHCAITEVLASSDGPATAVGAGGAVLIEDSTIWGSEGPLVYASGVSEPMRLRRTVVGGSRPDPQYDFDLAVYVDAGGELRMEDTKVVDSAFALAVRKGGRVSVASGEFARNLVALQVQEGSFLREVTSVPEVLAEGEVAIDVATRFLDNGVRVGSGEVPLPALGPVE